MSSKSEKSRGMAVGKPDGPQINHVARYGEMAARKSQLAPCLTSQLANYKCGLTAKQNNRRSVMMLKFGRVVVVSTAALALAAATIPSKAEASGYFPGGYGAVGYGGGGYYGSGSGCGCQAYVPPPPPPCCRVYAPPPRPCCVYGNGWDRGGYYGGGYGVGYDGGYGNGYGGYYGY
jgi:hypothetical protein